MCRLYGFRATDPTRVECSLVDAQNALLVQSGRDLRGVRNGDGWGLASWSGGVPSVEQRARAAYADLSFATSASATKSRTIVSHVRKATVGGEVLENTHPFRHGPWIFAHNGTVTALDRVAASLDPGAYGPPAGGTDSELVFRWLLSRMHEFGLDPNAPATTVDGIVGLVSSAVLHISREARFACASRPAKLNFLLSDGVNMVASRWGNSLYWTFRNGIRDCAVCGLSHCPDADEDYRAIVIASEPITDEPWQEVQEGSVVAVDADVNMTTWDLLVRAA
jgi:glutamine amidotransferase